MYNSNLLEIFKKYTSKEIKEFEDFVSSPYYNKNKNVISLFKLIKTEYPDFTKGNLTKEKIYKKIYSGTKYNDGTIRLLMFYLQELAEKFIGLKSYENGEYSSQMYLLAGLNERELDKVFEKNFKAVLKQLDKNPRQHAEYLYSRFVIESENLFYYSRTFFDRDEKYIQKSNVTEVFDNLTYSYLIRIFKYNLYFLNIQMKFNVNHKFRLFDELIYNHNPAEYEHIPVINMYYYCLMLTIKPDEEENFYKAKKLLFEHEQSFEADDKTEFYINLENYCKRRFKIGKMKYEQELFEIYQSEIEKKAYQFRGKMPDLFYKSVSDLGLRLKKYDWTKKFILDYKKELPEQFRENTFLHCMGVYEFAMDNFEKSLELISKVKFDEIYQKLDIKCLLNAIYYELDIQSSLEASIDTFRHFLKNDKIIPDERKEVFSIFNKNLLKLLKLRRKPDIEEIELFRDNIHSGNYYNKEWLLSKIDKLLKEHKV
jgi:hypothetical protein